MTLAGTKGRRGNSDEGENNGNSTCGVDTHVNEDLVCDDILQGSGSPNGREYEMIPLSGHQVRKWEYRRHKILPPRIHFRRGIQGVARVHVSALFDHTVERWCPKSQVHRCTARVLSPKRQECLVQELWRL